MADEMKSKLNEQLHMLIAIAYDVLDMQENQVSQETAKSLKKHYPKHLPGFKDLILDLQMWRESSMKGEEDISELLDRYTNWYTFICSCDNELSSESSKLDEIRGVVVCHNCGQTDYWLPESEIDADEVLIQDIK